MTKYTLKPNNKIDIRDFDPSEHKHSDITKENHKEYLNELRAELKSLQKIFYAQKKYRLLIILQGMDAAGKDGTVRNVFDGVDPNGVGVAHFNKPTQEELSRDYLWRAHTRVPKDGQIVIFNRSHYEDILIVRVQELKPEEVWEKRFEHINQFEKMLVDEGTHVLKLFLNIDKEEQKKRLNARIDNPDKHWKIDPNDFKDRQLWDKYIEAYNDAINKTNTPHAPWTIVPSNRKWYRNLIVTEIVVDVMRQLDLKYPPANEEFHKLKID